MLDYLWESLFSGLDPEEQEKFEAWIVEVARVVSDIILKHEYSEELKKSVLENNGLGHNFIHDDRTLWNIYNEDKDIEKAAYKILKIIKDNES